MFTGLIQNRGKVLSIEVQKTQARLRIACPEIRARLSLGASVSVNGVCLTASPLFEDGFEAQISPETLEKTSLRYLTKDSFVNLELPVQPQSFFGGHLVQGHVDGMGVVVSKEKTGDFWGLTIGFPEELASYIVEKGSIAVDGISLTVNTLYDSTYESTSLGGGEFELMVVPHTYENTNIQFLSVGQKVNLETDIIAKYVERCLGVYTHTPSKAESA